MPTADYRTSWDNFWHGVAATAGEAFWDCEPAQAVERETPYFEYQFSSSLTLLDVGCGNGTQTAALARIYRNVLGLDISKEAVAGANQLYAHQGLDFRVFDILDLDAATGLHAEFGDTNVYVRALLHQLRPEHRRLAVRTLSRLVGNKGQAFVVELSPTAEPLFTALKQTPGGPPSKFARVIQNGITPGTLSAGEVVELFAAEGLKAVYTGTSSIAATQTRADGSAIVLPCDTWRFTRAQ